MPRKTKPKATPETKPRTSKATEVSVFAPKEKGGAYIRTYSKEVHGADFKKLAEGFASKVSGRKIK